tara:strand:+ start:196 stop:825 length:630 start_codon:yes stop_codon:yes gene_type:complete
MIGTKSIPIVILTSFFTGMVSSVQAGYQMESSITPKWVIGSLVGETMLLELAPVITCLVLAGRVGATIAAEIGTMRVTEQIDALESLSLDPIAYLVFPRILAALIMFPVLTVIANVFGISGGIIAAMTTLDIDSYQFMKGLKTWFKPWDAWYGIIKGLSFGLAITSISCYFGFYTTGGAKGVGKSTTSSVVNSCIAIMILDYILASILL